MARGRAGFVNHFRDEPEGLEEVIGGGAWPVGAGWDLLGGARTSLVCWRGLGVDRSMVWAEGASGVEGAGWPTSPTSMASSQSEDASDSSSSEGGRASGRGGGIGRAPHSVEKASWSSPQLGHWGGEVGQQPEMSLESPPVGQVEFWHLWAERV